MKPSLTKILVTGSSGTIGTALCETLMDSGFEVVGVDIVPNQWNKKVQKITIQQDLRNEGLVKKLPAEIDLVIHLAANARVYNLVVDPSLARDNLLMLFNVLEYARNAGIKKLMFSSSREVYGNSTKESYSEDDARVENCESPYSASKIGGEALVYAYKNCYGMDFLIFRFSNVYGKYDTSDRVVPLFIKLTLENKDLVVFGKDKLLDFTYIDDTVNGIKLCIEKFDKVKNRTLNLATGEGVSLIKVAELVKEMLPSGNSIKVENNRVGEVVKYIADISRIKTELGFRPGVNIKEGLKRSVEWYSQHYRPKTDK